MDETTDPIEEYKTRFLDAWREYQLELDRAALQYQRRCSGAKTAYEDRQKVLYDQAVADGIIQHGEPAPWNIHQGGHLEITLKSS